MLIFSLSLYAKRRYYSFSHYIWWFELFFVTLQQVRCSYMIKIAHRIELQANNKQKTYFRKAIGCCRLAYNWGLEEWKRRYKAGERNLSGRKLRNDFFDVCALACANEVQYDPFQSLRRFYRDRTM